LIRLGNVSFGPDIREGVADWQDKAKPGRHCRNALWVERVERDRWSQEEVDRDQNLFATGVEVVAGYDRAGLIQDSIKTLQRDLLEEAVIVSIVIIVFLFHFRSALIPILTLPIAVIASFVPMYYLGVSSNIMSLGGIALAIGVLVDAAIVMVENGYRHLSEAAESKLGRSHPGTRAPEDSH